MVDTEDPQTPITVGIGASAGGLEALSQLVAGLDPDSPIAYVILQHVSPSHRSMMADILGRETALDVENMTDGTVPRAGCIYVVPASSVAVIQDGAFQLTEMLQDGSPKPPINEFLSSLATEKGEGAVGIVLSGTGSDGTVGLRAIQAEGGITMVQKPETAKYSGMPMAAIEAGVGDYMLSPEEMAERLVNLARLHPLGEDDLPQPTLDRLVGMVQEKRQIDFSGYKTGTLARRIKRRVVATGSGTVANYLEWTDAHPEELDLLVRDILISVTAFFRDPESFRALEELVGAICEAKEDGAEIRVWVAGCATGEEAYSIAIQFAEALRQQTTTHPIQIFATDIDDEALDVARRGIYPPTALAKVPTELVDKYFQPARDMFEVGKQLRDMVVFARHNLVDDPPFMRTDLIACRNVLIYFDHSLQAKVLKRFHFALNDGGYLFLGRSESIDQGKTLFSEENRQQSLYRKGEGGAIASSPQASTPAPAPSRSLGGAQQRRQTAERMLDSLVHHMGATAALCDREGNIQHTAGDVGRFLTFPKGTVRVAIGEVVIQPFQGELIAILHRLGQSDSVIHGEPHQVDNAWWQLWVFLEAGHHERHLLVLITPVDVSGATAETLPFAPTAEGEAVASDDQTQALREQLATANEQLQSLNEEAQASNEELQATNEELEASNEELQASNEELVSVNDELNTKTAQLTELNEEYQHLYDSLDFPILVLNPNLTLRRLNQEARERFNLSEAAVGESLASLRLPTYLADLDQRLNLALEQGRTQEALISEEGRYLSLEVVPGLDPKGAVQTLNVIVMDVTEVTRVQTELEASRQRLQTLMENTTIILAMKDLTGGYVYANRRFLDTFGLETQGYSGKTDFQLFPHAFAADIWARDLEALRAGEVVHAEHTLTGPGRERVFRTVHQVLWDGDGQPSVIITEAEDITERRRAEDQLRIAARVFENAGEAIVVTDATGQIQSINNAFTRITGFTEEDALGESVGGLLKSGRHSPAFYESMWESLQDRGFWQGEIWNRRKDGEIYPEWLTINRIDNEEDETQYFVAVFADITQLKDSQRKIEYLANHDALTGLPNRSLFQDRLGQALAVAERNQSQAALMFIDLDDFKTINDTLGHEVGDELLVQVAAQLRDVVRDVDTVARVGGDEFTVVLTGCDFEGAEYVAHRVVEGLAGSFQVGARSLRVTASVGLALYPQDGEDVDSLSKSADTAMYRAKDDGRNRVQLYEAELHKRLIEHSAMEEALRRALAQEELRLVYQPKFAADDPDRITGAEALLRWQDPEKGPISPGQFIPVAEKSGLILELGKRVEDLLCQQIGQWLAEGFTPPPIAFNVSPRAFRDGQFASGLFHCMAHCNVPPGQLQVEITEGTLIDNSDSIHREIRNLQEGGIDLAIDDFGTGYSSLGNLKQLPVAELKIDKSFVDGLGEDENDEAIAQASLAMAQALGLRTVAEGVETQQQLQWLQQRGCSCLQGFLLARPMEATDFRALLSGTGKERKA